MTERMVLLLKACPNEERNRWVGRRRARLGRISEMSTMLMPVSSFIITAKYEHRKNGNQMIEKSCKMKDMGLTLQGQNLSS